VTTAPLLVSLLLQTLQLRVKARHLDTPDVARLAQLLMHLLQPLLQQCIAVARGQHLVVFTQLHQPAVGIAATASL
jgi:hypothetical protein